MCLCGCVLWLCLWLCVQLCLVVFAIVCLWLCVGGGPAGNTASRSSRLRSGGEHSHPARAVEVRRGALGISESIELQACPCCGRRFIISRLGLQSISCSFESVEQKHNTFNSGVHILLWMWKEQLSIIVVIAIGTLKRMKGESGHVRGPPPQRIGKKVASSIASAHWSEVYILSRALRSSSSPCASQTA